MRWYSFIEHPKKERIFLKKNRFFAVIVVLVMLISFSAPAYAVSETAQLNGIYGDGMLFRQNDDVNISGTASAGSRVSAELKNTAGATVASVSTVAGTDGSFTLTFTAPAGGFAEYTIEIKENGRLFRTLRDVAFGELWLASGQSNIQYPLSQAKSAAEDFAGGVKQNKWVRALLVPYYPEYNGSDALVPCEPQEDIKNAVWISGEDSAIYSMSAVGFFFAEELVEKLGMPVGIINASLGGSSICSWLSRETIDNAPEVRDYLEDTGSYFEKSEWDEAEQSIYYDMTANFNGKIAPLKEMRISGMIWYQGETDLMLRNTQYDRQFELLQKSYTEHFSYKDGLLPVIYTKIAAYNYDTDGEILADWNILYDRIRAAEPSSRAVVSIYDIPVTYIPEAGLIHPESKEEVADRMAFSAMGMVYGEDTAYTAPTVKGYEIRGNEIFVFFTDVGDGLVCGGEILKGFAIAGADRIFTAADAEIVSAGTVRISAEGVASPVAFSYAYCVDNGDSNLYASESSVKTLPAAEYISEKTEDSRYWKQQSFTCCDTDTVWYTEDDSFSGYYPSFTADNAVVSFGNAFGADGDGMCIEASARRFAVSPVLTYKDRITEKSFSSAITDFSDYGTLSFYVRNDGECDVTFDGLRFYESSALWYAPAVIGTLDTEYVIPADGEFHKVTLDLDRIYHLGNECSLSYDNEKLGNIRNIEFSFSCKESDARLSFDSISFTPSSEDSGTRYDVILSNADDPIEFFTGLVLFIFGKFAALFGM